MSSLSVIILPLVFLISTQGLTCDDSCYDISLDSVSYDAVDNAQCYTYTVTLESADPCNTIPAGETPKVLFGIDTSNCYINALDLAAKITAYNPFTHSIKEDDSNGNIIGIEFTVDTSNSITFCIQGIPTGAELTTGPFQLSDSTNECSFQSDNASPNFCGICDGDLEYKSCFCAPSEDECLDNARPRGDLLCDWDSTNSRCIADYNPSCVPTMPDSPCICFWSADICVGERIEAGRIDCGWDSARNLCSPVNCTDAFECDCLKFPQDCLSAEIVDFPGDCIWTQNDTCIEVTPTPTTAEPTTSEPTTNIPTADPTAGCVDSCGCFTNQVDCERDTAEMVCVWQDECIEQTPTPTTAAPTTAEPTTANPTERCVDTCGCFTTQVDCEMDTAELSCVWQDECIEFQSTTDVETTTAEPTTASPTTVSPTTAAPTRGELQSTTNNPVLETVPQTTTQEPTRSPTAPKVRITRSPSTSTTRTWNKPSTSTSTTRTWQKPSTGWGKSNGNGGNGGKGGKGGRGSP